MINPKQSSLPGFQPSDIVKRVDVFMRCDTRKQLQSCFYDNLSLWLTFPIHSDIKALINIDIAPMQTNQGWVIKIIKGGEPLVKVKIYKNQGRILVENGDK